MATGRQGPEGALEGAVKYQADVVATEMEAVAHELNAALAAVAREGAAEVSRADESMHQLRSVSAPLENLAAPTRQLESLGRIVGS